MDHCHLCKNDFSPTEFDTQTRTCDAVLWADTPRHTPDGRQTLWRAWRPGVTDVLKRWLFPRLGVGMNSRS